MEWTLFNLPVHPLVVHAAVVLVPLAALGVLAIAFVPSWRQRFGALVFGTALVGALCAFLAKESGEALEEAVGESAAVEAHAELGDTVMWVAVPLALVALALWLVSRVAKRLHVALSILLIVVAVAVSAAALVQIVRIGHSGAEAVWGATTAVAPSADTDGD